MPFEQHETQGQFDGEITLYQDGYIVHYDDDLKSPLWASYKLTDQDRTNAAGKRWVNFFRKDARLKKSQNAIKADYNEPTYDQGQMANDADLKDDLIEQLNTYVLTNMSPQHCAFNRVIWLSLEDITRAWARPDVYGELYVTSGAIFDRDDVIGRDLDVDARRMESRNNGFRVGVPSHYYKTILRQKNGKWFSISFLLEHDNDRDGLSWNEVKPTVIASITTIEDIEARANIKLHPSLTRELLEQYKDGDDWDLSLGKNNMLSFISATNNCMTYAPK
jgi:DNA/RNA endonuclease G (NUC1)